MLSQEKTVFLFLVTLSLIAKNVNGDCRKTFIYNQKYTYGYDIYCLHTTNAELSSTMARNEISLTIVNSDVTITNLTFQYLRKIRNLNITNSQLAFENSHQTSGNVLTTLDKLDTLIIQHTNITTPISVDNSYLHGLSNLKTLILDNNNIDGFPNGTFKDLSNLKTLSLKNNRIKSLTTLNICNLISLRHLDLSNNTIGQLNNEDIKCLTQLESLNLSGNVISKLHGISSTSLNVLSLSANQIDCIEKIDAPKLTTLDLSLNHLTNITNDDLKELNSLSTLNVSYNSLKRVQLNNKLLKYLDLSYNKLKEIPNYELTQLTLLNLSSNELVSISNRNFSMFKNLETINLSRNKLHAVESNTFLSMSKLKDLNLSGNVLNNMSLVFVKNSTVQSFNVSHNLLGNISKDLFTNLSQLKHFDVSFNKIKSLNDTIFEKLENLETLNMSNNLLTELDYKTVEPLESLIVLDVDNNLIKELDYSSIVSELPNLDAFKAKNNLLTCEFLTKMIHYFKDNDITFSLNEHLDFDKENVEGIYCKETETKLLHLEQTEEALANNTKMLNELYSINKKMVNGLSARTSAYDKNENYSLSGGEIVACVLGLISLVVLITLAVQKTVMWHRRRSYLVDELELINNEPYKRLG